MESSITRRCPRTSFTTGDDALERAAGLGQLLIRLEVDAELRGGLAIYGRRFWRYPLDPTVIFLLRR